MDGYLSSVGKSASGADRGGVEALEGKAYRSVVLEEGCRLLKEIEGSQTEPAKGGTRGQRRGDSYAVSSSCGETLRLVARLRVGRRGAIAKQTDTTKRLNRGDEPMQE